MMQTARQLIDAYRKQFKADPSAADKSLLQTARESLDELLKSQLQEGYLEADTVHLANEISYFFGGNKEVTVNALSQYLTQPITVEEEAWARWELIDNLAMLRQCQEVVGKHRDFLAWGREQLDSDKLLWVMYDGTQAFCWRQAGKGDEWLQIFEHIIATVAPSSVNRYDRFIYLRTANAMYRELGRWEAALHTVNQIRDLSEEDPAWEPSFGIRIESYAAAITVHWKLQDTLAMRRIAEEASAELKGYREQHPDLNFDQRRKLSGLYHNLAASLYFARQYDLAIPLFRSAIDLGIWEHWTYTWLAASLWATTQSRAEVLPILKQGADRVVGAYDSWTTVPEFADVVADAEFLAASGDKPGVQSAK